MVRKIYKLGEENPRKKYRGIFDNIYPHGYNGWRLIIIKPESGKNEVLLVDWRELTKQRKEKNITIGDKIKIDYRDEYNFTIKKLTGK